MAETPKYPSPSWAPPPQKESPKVTSESNAIGVREGIQRVVWNRQRWRKKISGTLG